MTTTHQLTAIIEREDDGYVAFCPELDVASQGDTVEDARSNLAEAIELFFEAADPTEIKQRPARGSRLGSRSAPLPIQRRIRGLGQRG